MGVLGFCFGGRMAMLFGARSRELDAVIAFHPGITRHAEVARLKAPVLIHHGTADRAVAVVESERIAGVLKAQGTSVHLHRYEGAEHGFLAYTRPTYRQNDARLAWSRTVEFLKKQL
jgi:carboxymethylenebutenolidase